MPLYTFEHPVTGEMKDIVFGMNDDKEYKDEEDTIWKRVWHTPSAAIDSDLDPFSSKQFVEKTNTRGTLGDLEQRSKEMSEKRKDKLGYDPVQQKYFKEYASRRNGTRHYLDKG